MYPIIALNMLKLCDIYITYIKDDGSEAHSER